jgi:16S rRNA G527 N7-methylase RsmG
MGDSKYANEIGSIDITKVDWNNASFDDFSAIEQRLVLNKQFIKNSKLVQKEKKIEKKIEENRFQGNCNIRYKDKNYILTYHQKKELDALDSREKKIQFLENHITSLNQIIDI